MLLRMLDIKHTGGDVKDAFPCHQHEITVLHTNTDIIDNEDDDVKAERERVKDIFNKNNIRVSVSFSWYLFISIDHEALFSTCKFLFLT